MDKRNIINEDELYFTINQVAKEIGVVAGTIRNWEKHGIFEAKRSSNGYRIYTLKDIEKLRNIKKYSKDKHMGVNAIKMIYSNEDELAKPIADDNSVIISKKNLGEEWKRIRLDKNYLLEDVAKRTGISASYLSKIENSQANASFDVLEKLNKFYETDMDDHLETKEESHVVRNGKGELLETLIQGMVVESVSALENHTLIPMIYTVEPGKGRNNPTTHVGEEFLYILKGRIEVNLEGKKFVLSKGDSFLYKSQKNHSWKNIGTSKAKILWIYTSLVQM